MTDVALWEKDGDGYIRRGEADAVLTHVIDLPPHTGHLFEIGSREPAVIEGPTLVVSTIAGEAVTGRFQKHNSTLSVEIGQIIGVTDPGIAKGKSGEVPRFTIIVTK